jgi:Na+-translocating ferredoxin:NAD+ oxidoreductase subunit D
MMLQVSSSPHIRDSATTRRLMLDVIIALLPALGVSIYMFGLRSLLVIVLTTASAVLFEFASRKWMKRDQTAGDLSAVVTGLLLAFNLPPTIPLWIPIVGSFIAIVIVKQLFGGIGQNFANPAITARIILTLSFPAFMTRWAVLSGRAADYGIPASESITDGLDLVATATPLAVMQSGEAAQGAWPTYLDLFLGFKGGCLGEVSIIALLIGAAYLFARKVIAPWIPLSFIGTVALLTFLFGQDPLYHVLSGGLVLGAFFMATDYVTSPMTMKGKIIFGVGCGIITAFIRLFGSLPEGVSFSILLMNILTPHIERWTIPVPFGGGARRVKS